MRLLIVEDEARIAGFLVKGLKASGYEVEHVSTGTEALERTRKRAAYQAVVLDLGLPDMNGLEVLRRLRTQGNTVPVIIHTAHEGERQEGLRLGADDFLVKPLPFGHLLASVQEHV